MIISGHRMQTCSYRIICDISTCKNNIARLQLAVSGKHKEKTRWVVRFVSVELVKGHRYRLYIRR